MIQKLKALFKFRRKKVDMVEPVSKPQAETEAEINRYYSADHPIGTKAEDRFNRWPFAQRIADTIARRDDPSGLVLGIYGVWGDGKTSVLHLMEEAFQTYTDVIVVKFNPWHFQSEAQLLKGFFETLADALGRSLPTKVEELGGILKRYGSILSLASLSLFGGVAQISPGSGVRELGEQLSTVELSELRERLERILKEAKKRVVVLIDDIDRLDKQEIQGIFKLVKLSAGFELTAYVLAFDDEIVSDSLGEKYGKSGSAAGRSFLEKIVQVPLHLPPADKITLRRLTFEGIDAALKLSGIELTEDQSNSFVRHFIDGLEAKLITPRQARRYTNALSFALPILKGEVHPVDQMLIEGIRVFYPQIYAVIRKEPDVFLGKGLTQSHNDAAKKRALEVIQEATSGLDPREQSAAKDLIQVLFPRLKSVLGNMNYGSEADERWTKEQRISSTQYFQRYFQYAVPSRDVPDQAVRKLLDEIVDMDEVATAEALKKLAAPHAASSLVLKLRLQEDLLEEPVARKLAVVIARNGELFPKDEVVFSFASTFSQAAILVMKLGRRVSGGVKREEFARLVIAEASPLPFAFECLRFFRTDKDESERFLPVSVEEELGKLLANRIQASATQSPPYFLFPDRSHALLWLWNKYGSPSEVGVYLSQRFTATPKEVLSFLATYVPTAWGMESGLPHKSDFNREHYNSVADLVNPETILGHLKSIYGEKLNAAEYYVSRDTPFEERIASQFAYIHKEVLVERLEKKDP